MANFSDNIKKYVDKAAVKTSETIDMSKKYVEVLKIEKRLKVLYERLGRAVYNTENEISPEDEVKAKVMKQIENTEREYVAAKKAYELSKSVKCPFCGKPNPNGSKYCKHCGEMVK